MNERLVRRSDDAAALAQRSGRLLRALNVAFGLSWRLYENSPYTFMHMHIYAFLFRYIYVQGKPVASFGRRPVFQVAWAWLSPALCLPWSTLLSRTQKRSFPGSL